MKYTVYKSLDNPSSMFGIQGSYLRYAVIGVGAAALIGIIIGRIAGQILGIIVFVAVAILAVAGVFWLQAKYSERERQRWIASWKTRDIVIFPPLTIRGLILNNQKKLSESDSSDDSHS